MNEILKVDFDTQTVSARELHEQLKIGTRFNDWFPRMTEYGFSEGNDFYSKMSKTSETGGRPQKGDERDERKISKWTNSSYIRREIVHSLEEV